MKNAVRCQCLVLLMFSIAFVPFPLTVIGVKELDALGANSGVVGVGPARTVAAKAATAAKVFILKCLMVS